MARTIALRVGICECTRRYHQRLEGRRLKLSYLGGRSLRQPIVLQLREVRIPEFRHAPAIRLGRCHAFLDVHRRDDGHNSVWIDLVDLWRDQRGHQQVALGWRSQLYTAWWVHETLPTIASVAKTLQSLIQGIPKRRFQRWQQRMTPTGWKEPTSTQLSTWNRYR